MLMDSHDLNDTLDTLKASVSKELEGSVFEGIFDKAELNDQSYQLAIKEVQMQSAFVRQKWMIPVAAMLLFCFFNISGIVKFTSSSFLSANFMLAMAISFGIAFCFFKICHILQYYPLSQMTADELFFLAYVGISYTIRESYANDARFMDRLFKGETLDFLINQEINFFDFFSTVRITDDAVSHDPALYSNSFNCRYGPDGHSTDLRISKDISSLLQADSAVSHSIIDHIEWNLDTGVIDIFVHAA